MTKILDCTLRDGGYYTNWDFPIELVDKYIDTVNNLPIDYIEIGYRNNEKKEYMGEYFYTPIETIDRIRSKLENRIKIAIMINTKDINSLQGLEYLLTDCIGKIDLVRFATSSSNINSAVLYASKVKELGFEVAMNLMYMSQKTSSEIIKEVNYITQNINDIDYIYLVDSYGSVLPSEVREKFNAIKGNNKQVACGFHGHDNIQLAFANSLEAINSGVEIIDSTIAGMGRGAGNLSSEIICSYIATENNIDINYSELVSLTESFIEYKNIYGWGSSLPYIISGFNKLPQREVMDLISLNRFSTKNIINIIENKINNKFPKSLNNEIEELTFNLFKDNNYDFSILIGGGNSVIKHKQALKTLNEKYNILFIHSTTKHLDLFLENNYNNLVCLPGDEVRKLKNFDINNKNVKFIISPESEIENSLLNNNLYLIGRTPLDEELEGKIFTKDAPLFMTLKVLDVIKMSDFYLIGFDGYEDETQKNKVLREENQTIINYYSEFNDLLVSLTPSNYDFKVKSIYSLLVHGNNNFTL